MSIRLSISSVVSCIVFGAMGCSNDHRDLSSSSLNSASTVHAPVQPPSTANSQAKDDTQPESPSKFVRVDSPEDSAKQFERGWQLEHGLQCSFDRVAAHKCYLEAAKTGCLKASVAAALMEYLQHVPSTSPEKAADLVREKLPNLVKQAEQGDPRSQVILGTCYFRECGTTRNPEQSLMWFRKASEQNCPVGMAHYALMLQLADRKHDTEAIDLLRRSSELGNREADFLLACSYEAGTGVPIDHGQMVHHCRRAAENGNEWAEVNLGLYYAKGLGVTADELQAFDWFLRAARKGMPDAVRFCGYYLCNSRDLSADRRTQALDQIEEAIADGRPMAAVEFSMTLFELAKSTKDIIEFERILQRAHTLLCRYAQQQDATAWYALVGLFQLFLDRHPRHDQIPSMIHYCRKRSGSLGNKVAAQEAKEIDAKLNQARRNFVASVNADNASYLLEEDNGGFIAPTSAHIPTKLSDLPKAPQLTDDNIFKFKMTLSR